LLVRKNFCFACTSDNGILISNEFVVKNENDKMNAAGKY